MILRLNVLPLLTIVLLATLGGGLVACASDDGQTPSPSSVSPEPDATAEPEGPGQAPAVGVPPSIESATAAQIGIRGQSVVIAVQGSDEDDDATGLVVVLLDAQGQEISLFDRDGDGLDDDPEQRVLLDIIEPPSAETHTFVAAANLPGILDRVDDAQSVRVWLVDREGARSTSVDATIAQQTVAADGASCDPTYVLTRCSYGMGCAGEPAVCNEGTAPQIERLAYFRRDDSTEILVDGIEAEDDLKAIFIEFFDRSGDPVLLDLDGDGEVESSSFNADVYGAAIDGRFLVRLEQSAGFSDAVEQITVTAVDDNAHTGESVSARVSLPPVRGFNQSCDLFGFDVCSNGAACSPNANGNGGRCQTVGPLQSEMCADAPVIEPGDTVSVTLAGDAFGASLWDPPSECAANNPSNRPEGAVVLHLSEPAAGLRIRTDYEGTDFDTIVYVVEGCPREIEAPIGCDDDGGLGVFSDLDIDFVPAGDYLIVVDSYDVDGGNFVMTVEVES